MNRLGKKIDKTFLSVDQAEKRGFLHRDYIAHCFRWSHVVKEMYRKGTYKDARVLDVGCGRETPLLRLLHSSRLAPASYTGIDYGPINDPGTVKPVPELWENEDFAVWGCEETFTHIVSFEVLEHVEPEHMIRMLKNMKRVLAPGGRIYLSTPCWNMTDCAANHVNEMKYEVLGSILEALGFEIVASYGTFASIRDYQDMLSYEQTQLFDELREYYDTNVLACIFAPLFPAQSRNALWTITHAKEGYKCQFSSLGIIAKPWGSSKEWTECNI